MTHRLRSEHGIGTVELLIATIVLLIGLAALLGGILSGQTATRNAGSTTTAAALATTQLQAYRSLPYTAIALDLNQGGRLDDTYTTDTAYTNPANIHTPASSDCTTTTSSGICLTPACTLSNPALCTPVQPSVIGADNHRYRIDTYIFATQLSTGTLTGRPLKKITVVVRDTTSPNTTYAREELLIDRATS